MKILSLKKFQLAALIGAALLQSCGGGDKQQEKDELAVADTAPAVDNQSKGNQVESNEVSYQVPSPKEMFQFIRQVGSKNNKRTDILNGPDKAKSYTEMKDKSVNFGVYSCDLTYCSIFEIGTEAIKYFKVVKQLGEDLGVSTAIRADMLKRLQNNMSNPDSLVEIADDLYFSSFETLQNGQQGNVLAMVVAGGYIEGLYIATNLIKYEKNSPAIERIAGEKFTLENITDFMKKYESDPAVKEALAKLNELKVVFDKDVTSAESKDLSLKKENGKTVLGGEQLSMTEGQYNAICDKIAEIRNAYTGK